MQKSKVQICTKVNYSTAYVKEITVQICKKGKDSTECAQQKRKVQNVNKSNIK